MAIRTAWACAVGLMVGAVVLADDPMPDPKAPPYQRMLKGDDAKKAVELDRQIAKLEAAGKRDEARKAAEELLALRTRVQGADHWQVRDAEWRLKHLSRLLGEGERAKFAEAVELSRRVTVLFSAREYEKARELADRALAIRQEVLGEGHPEIATGLFNSGVVYRALHRRAEAERLLTRALSTFREAVGPDHPGVASIAGELALLYRDDGRLAEAEKLLKDALRARTGALGPQHPDTVRTLNNLAAVFRDLKRYSDATLAFSEVLRARQSALGPNHVLTARAQHNVGVAYGDWGRYADAEPLLKASLSTIRAEMGSRHPDTAAAAYGLGLLYRDQGRDADAEALIASALQVWAEQNPMPPEVVSALEALALVRKDQSRFASAEALLRRALEVSEEMRGTDPVVAPRLRANLALVYRDRGKYAAAEALLNEVLRARLGRDGPDHPDTADAQESLALACLALERYPAAEALLKDALRVTRRTYGDLHPVTARILRHLGSVYFRQGRYAEAESHLTESAAAFEVARLTAAVGIDRAVASDGSPYPLLALTAVARGKPGAAVDALEHDHARGLLDHMPLRGSGGPAEPGGDTRARVAERLSAIEPRMLVLATQPTTTATERKELEALTAERRALEGQLAELAATASRLEVADLAAIRKALPPDAAWVFWLDRTGGEHTAAWACVVRPAADPVWVRLTGTGDGGKWTAADAALPARLRVATAGGDAVVVRMPVPGHAPISVLVPLGGRTLLPPTAAAAAAAQALRAQRVEPVLKHLEGVRALYVTTVGPMAGVPVEVLAPEFAVSYTPSGTFLARLKDRPRPQSTGLLALGDPVFARPGPKPNDAPLPAGGVLVAAVAPDGPAARAGIRPGDVLLKYGDADLRDPKAFAKAVTAANADKPVPVVVWRPAPGAPVTREVAAGDPGVKLDPDPAPVALDRRRKFDAVLARGGEWQPLPGTRVEAERLRALFGDRATVLVGPDASEQKLDALRRSGALKKARYLHLATHGQGNTVRALESALILAQDRLPGDLTARPKEPLLDGKLTAREVLDNWELDAELVTLSACETAAGVRAGGDGLLGFAQAFLARGARAVCLSLWAVDDTATALLMTRFYRNLLGRRGGLAGPLPKAAALAEAKRWLRDLPADEAKREAAAVREELTRLGVKGVDGPIRGEKTGVTVVGDIPKVEKPGDKPYAHPNYWAAFVLVGDPN